MQFLSNTLYLLLILCPKFLRFFGSARKDKEIRNVVASSINRGRFAYGVEMAQEGDFVDVTGYTVGQPSLCRTNADLYCPKANNCPKEAEACVLPEEHYARFYSFPPKHRRQLPPCFYR